MAHPKVDDLIAYGRAPDGAGDVAAHLGRCAACRDLLAICAPSASPPTPRPPEVLGPQAVDAGLYDDRALLHRGGMGRAFGARDRRVGRRVVIKQMLEPSSYADTGTRDRARARFEREASLTARLQHPSIVGVYEVGRWPDGEPFYTMPFVRGRALAAEIESRPTVRERLALLGHAIAACDAIAYAHTMGVVHRDIKPENILVGEFGETVVIDWGLAKDLRAGDPDDPVIADPGRGGPLTRLGVGTPAYMPPEQARGEPPDERVDVYALGATIYHLLAGAPPFSGAPTREVRGRLVDGPPEPLAKLGPEVPRSLIAIVDKAMARDRGQRFASAVELAEELRRFETGQLTHTYRYRVWEVFAHWVRRHREIVAAGVAALLAAVAIGGYAVLRISAARDRATASEQRARLELERARGAVAGQLARDPQRRLDGILAGVEAVGAALHAGREPVAEAAAGLFAALTRGPAAVRLGRYHGGGVSVGTPQGDRIAIAVPGALRVWRIGVRDPVAEHVVDVEQPVRALVSPGGARVLITGADRRLAAVDLKAGRAAYLDRHVAYSRGAAWLDDRRLITTDLSGLAIAWNAEDGRPFATWQAGEGIAAVGAVAGRALIGTASGALWRWDFSREPVRVGGHGAEIIDIVAHARGGLSVSRDGEVQAWGPTLDAPIARRRLEGGPVVLAAVAPAGDRAAVWLEPATLRAVAIPTLADLGPPIGGSLARFAQPFSPDGGELLVLTPTRAPIRVVRVDSGVTVASFEGHDTRVAAAWFLPGDLVFTAARSGAFVWDPALHGLAPHASEVSALDVDARGERLLSCSLDGTVRVAAVDGSGAREVARDESGCLAAAFGPDGRVVAGFAGGRAMWADGAGRARWLDGHAAAVGAVASGQGFVVSASTDGTARIWRDGAGEPVVLGHDTAVITAAIRPGGTIVTGAADGVARIWDVGGGLRAEVRAVVPAASGTNAPGDPAVAEPAGTGAFVGPGGRVLAGGVTRSTLWTAGDRPTSDLFGRPASTACNPFLPDGGVALVTGAGRLAAYGPDGARRWTILAHDGAIACATAGAAGDRIVTAGLDGAVRWWRASDGEMIGELRGPAPALQARWTPDGRVLLSAFADGTVRADPTDVRAALGRGCATARRFGEHAAVAANCGGLARAKP